MGPYQTSWQMLTQSKALQNYLHLFRLVNTSHHIVLESREKKNKNYTAGEMLACKKKLNKQYKLFPSTIHKQSRHIIR